MNYNTDELNVNESVELYAIKDPMREDSPGVYTGKRLFITERKKVLMTGIVMCC